MASDMERTTRQRRAILDTFEKVGQPLSPAEILKRASKKIPNLNLATVYRNLKAMVARADLVQVDVLGQAPRYELAGLPHHHHFLCEKCDRLYDVAGCPRGIHRLAPQGFKVKIGRAHV